MENLVECPTCGHLVDIMEIIKTNIDGEITTYCEYCGESVD